MPPAYYEEFRPGRPPVLTDPDEVEAVEFQHEHPDDPPCNNEDNPGDWLCTLPPNHLCDIHIAASSALILAKWGDAPPTPPAKAGRLQTKTIREDCPKCGTRWSIDKGGVFCQNCGIAAGGEPE